MSTQPKTLVAYFSCSGVTRRAAQALAHSLGADLYEIQPQSPYTTADLDWNNPNSRSSREMNDSAARPAMGSPPLDAGLYDRVFVGFPIWWYLAPRIIQTFLESHDFSGKTLALFATSGGSGLGNTEQVLHASCPAATWRPGRLLNGGLSPKDLGVWAQPEGQAR